jgi:hypothetical protein
MRCSRADRPWRHRASPAASGDIIAVPEPIRAIISKSQGVPSSWMANREAAIIVGWPRASAGRRSSSSNAKLRQRETYDAAFNRQLANPRARTHSLTDPLFRLPREFLAVLLAQERNRDVALEQGMFVSLPFMPPGLRRYFSEAPAFFRPQFAQAQKSSKRTLYVALWRWNHRGA